MSIEHVDNASGEGRFIDRLTSAPARLRRELLTAFVREQLAYATEIDKAEIAPDDKLMDLGINSLTAVEVKLFLEAELGIALGSSLLFDYPTLEGLVGYLLNEAGFCDQQVVQKAARTDTPAEPSDVPNSLSEEQLAELLAAELADFERSHHGA
jgi:acyl carrier protein